MSDKDRTTDAQPTPAGGMAATSDGAAGGATGSSAGEAVSVQAADLQPADLAVGIDFGGSGIKSAVVRLSTGELVTERVRIPTPQPSLPRECVALMGGLVRQVVDATGATGLDSIPVGLGFPAAIRNGTPLTAANVDQTWIGFPAETEMSLVMKRTVAVGNDADVAGLAEIRFGAGRGQGGVVFVITIGTGIGTALFVDGRLVPNTELGHMELRGGDAEKHVSDAARDRDNLSWSDWGVRFNEYLAMLERLFWPDLFILGGGASKRTEKFINQIKVKTPVVPATLRNNAGIVGAALIASDKLARDAADRTGERF